MIKLDPILIQQTTVIWMSVMDHIKIVNVSPKGSVYILTPKYHQKVMTVAKHIYRFINKVSILFNAHMQVVMTPIDGGIP